MPFTSAQPKRRGAKIDAMAPPSRLDLRGWSAGPPSKRRGLSLVPSRGTAAPATARRDRKQCKAQALHLAVLGCVWPVRPAAIEAAASYSLAFVQTNSPLLGQYHPPKPQALNFNLSTPCGASRTQ